MDAVSGSPRMNTNWTNYTNEEFVFGLMVRFGAR